MNILKSDDVVILNYYNLVIIDRNEGGGKYV